MARKPYNLLGGEWWYSTIKPKLYIEEDIAGEGGSCPEYKFQCANGELMFVYHPKYDNGNYQGAGIFDADFKWVDGVELHRAQNIKSDPPSDAKLMLEIVKQLAGQFDFIRVDLYNPKRGEVILGELTISPGGGLDAFRPTSFDEKLGAKWDFSRYFL